MPTFLPMRVALPAVAMCMALAGCGAAQRSAAPSPTQISAAFAGSPAPLARLHARASALLPSSPGGLRSVLAGLRGYPVVINQWGSWCPPCRAEFPSFQRASVARGRSVAFLGIDGGDAHRDAQSFLRQFPVSYPSYEDPNGHIAQALHASYYPTTLFYDARGKLAFLHAGPYLTQAQLLSDIQRYLHA